MKTLILVRHAKSSWDHDVADVNRPLSTRGFNDVNLLSKEFLKHKIRPDGIFSSPANRALTTCNIFMENCNFDASLLKISNELYDFDGAQVVDFIRSLKDDYQIIMIFGHNHAFTAIANKFGNKFIENVPTCGLVMIHFETDSWKNIDKGHTNLTLFPKELKE